MATKQCSKCSLSLPSDQFNSGGKKGPYSECKACRAAYMRAHRAKNRDRYNAWHREYRRKHKDLLNAQARASRAKTPEKSREYTRNWRKNDPVRALFFAAKQRAKLYGIPFSISRDDIVMPERCPVLGIPFGPNTGRGMGSHADSPSLDRIDPKLGYVPGNVQVMSRRANTMKADASEEELEAFALWVLRRKYGTKRKAA